ncbi:hypothetical protein PHYSODRAFT_306879 [Phytophthora sojae]|uniref:Uncharacterized protein n=1 Tax=Phytophthora sojae (strain P6497) TaxID=1094619 RepID=G5ABG6_PHYSP|nr:hypothetical protein PHYSODRAFT_306879 [Phytophthora sojae]EGZ06691.1 hypothetical protein PHYSODRAFT_306879 [Phytophthora sojae]|eukprot:XP_009537455.1 hypothetical protein PHYSODRAFT_306879 [Phytophthora sojae]
MLQGGKPSDTEWLVGRGGARLCSMWKNLEPDTRCTLLNQTPDQSVPFDEYGVLDERFSTCARDSDTATPSVDASTLSDLNTTSIDARSSSGDNSEVVMDLQARFERARSNYYEVVANEKRAELQIVYDKSSLGGVLSTAVTMAKNAVQLARLKGRAQTPQYAFEEVPKQLSDVFNSIEDVTQFDPELRFDGPSPSFAAARIAESRKKYRSNLLKQHGVLGKRQSHEDPDKPLLPPRYKYFGRHKGFLHFEPGTY